MPNSRRAGSSRPGVPPRRRSAGFRTILRTYTSYIRPRADAELACFRKEPTVVSAVERAALATNCEGKRYAHQRRIKRAALEAARRGMLNNLGQIRRARDFEQLFSILQALLEPIYGIGELYIYDTALRIGAKLGFLPARVYLHAGTRVGARALGLNTRLKAIDLRSLPVELRILKPHEIEDVLCIFKSELARLGSRSVPSTGPRKSWCD